MLKVSPPVSPSVVARILKIQKPSVTSGTFVAWWFEDVAMLIAEPQGPGRRRQQLRLPGGSLKLPSPVAAREIAACAGAAETQFLARAGRAVGRGLGAA